jgi:thiamine-phosphate pyrophosphorylase
MVRELTSRYQALFIVNDHADIALAVDADGVHLGQDDLPLAVARRIMGDRIIGISTHALSEAVAAARGGADYIGFGPIFPTATKDAGNPQGPGALRPIIAAVRIPVIAIGGIAPGNAASVAVAGCRHVAVSSGIVTGDVVGNVKALTASLGCS